MKRIFIICCIFLSPLSCTNEYDNPIPLTPVYLNLDLTFEDRALKAIPSCKTYTDKNINPALGERRGFSGILVVHTLLDEYKAFDRTCPYEAQAGITVEVDEALLYAVCPQCGSRYEIGFGTGSLSEGSGRYGLRSYTATLSGSKLIIKN